MDENLISELKTNLLINWEDEEIEKKLKQSLDGAKAHIESLTGTKLDFEKDIFAKNLLMNCARYYYNNVPEFFEDNFQKEILRIQFLEALNGSDDE